MHLDSFDVVQTRFSNPGYHPLFLLSALGFSRCSANLFTLGLIPLFCRLHRLCSSPEDVIEIVVVVYKNICALEVAENLEMLRLDSRLYVF